MKKTTILLCLCLLFSIFPTPIKANDGWVTTDGKWYYYDNSVKKTGWYHDEKDCWYFFEKDGSMKTGWIASGDYWYYLNPANGILQTGWQEIGGKKYFLNTGGIMQKNSFVSKGIEYIFDLSGALIKEEIYEDKENLIIDNVYLNNMLISNYDYIVKTIDNTYDHYCNNVDYSVFMFNKIDYNFINKELDIIDSVITHTENVDDLDSIELREALDELLLFLGKLQIWIQVGIEYESIPVLFPEYDELYLENLSQQINKLNDELNLSNTDFNKNAKQMKQIRTRYLRNYKNYVDSYYYS